jgi:hypothetical protein
MMKNAITVTIPFSFKGKEMAPSIVLDLDQFCRLEHSPNILHHHIATENKIDQYSYEYDVLECSPLYFSDATGLALGFCVDGSFDLNAYKQCLQEQKMHQSLQNIAFDIMGIEDLDLEQHTPLKQALSQAYNEGKTLS